MLPMGVVSWSAGIQLPWKPPRRTAGVGWFIPASSRAWVSGVRSGTSMTVAVPVARWWRVRRRVPTAPVEVK